MKAQSNLLAGELTEPFERNATDIIFLNPGEGSTKFQWVWPESPEEIETWQAWATLTRSDNGDTNGTALEWCQTCQRLWVGRQVLGTCGRCNRPPRRYQTATDLYQALEQARPP